MAARWVEVRGRMYNVYILYTLYIEERIVSDFYPKGFTDDVLCFPSYSFYHILERADKRCSYYILFFSTRYTFSNRS